MSISSFACDACGCGVNASFLQWAPNMGRYSLGYSVRHVSNSWNNTSVHSLRGSIPIGGNKSIVWQLPYQHTVLKPIEHQYADEFAGLGDILLGYGAGWKDEVNQVQGVGFFSFANTKRQVDVFGQSYPITYQPSNGANGLIGQVMWTRPNAPLGSLVTSQGTFYLPNSHGDKKAFQWSLYGALLWSKFALTHTQRVSTGLQWNILGPQWHNGTAVTSAGYSLTLPVQYVFASGKWGFFQVGISPLLLQQKATDANIPRAQIDFAYTRFLERKG